MTGFWSLPDLAGADYLWLLDQLHEQLKPRTYLEIGVETGVSLRLARCASVGVDPDLSRIEGEVSEGKPVCHLFEMTSDAFFRETALPFTIDMAFIDGLHHFDQVLRDFLNVEKLATPGSTILLHDCIPTDAWLARRDFDDETFLSQTRFERCNWAGDVWKVLPILQQFRPDLMISAFDAAPTGLVAVTHLDPQSDVLRTSYAEIVSRFMPLTVPNYGELEILPTISPIALQRQLGIDVPRAIS